MKWLLACFCAVLSAQVAKQANSGYRTEEGRKGVAESLAKETRIEELRPKELLAAIGVQAGMTVADIGTGAGVMLPFLSAAVGSNGKVIAEDIFPDFLETAKKRASGLANVSFVLGTDADPNLPPGIDIAMTVDVYHHFDYPDKMLAAIGRALKPGGKFIVVDIHKSKEAMPNGRALEHIRLSADDAVKEIEGLGWKLVERRDHAPGRLWLGVFTKR